MCERVLGKAFSRSCKYLARLTLVVEPGSHLDFFFNGCGVKALREFQK